MFTHSMKLLRSLVQGQRNGFLSVAQDIRPEEKHAFVCLVQLGYIELWGRDGIEVTAAGKAALRGMVDS